MWRTCFNSGDRRRCSDICYVICKSNWRKSKCYFKGREQKKICRNIWRRFFFFNSSGNWEESLCGGKVDLIIDSIGPATFLKYFDVLKPNGRIVNFGASSGDKIELPLRALFYNQIDIMGTSMGSSEEFNEMIKFIEKYKIKPIMDKVYSLEEAIQALRRMEQGEQFGNIALRME